MANNAATKARDTLSKEIVTRLQIDELFFVLSAGLFFVATFPFDIFRISERIVSDFSLDFYTKIPSLVQENFAPLANISYFGREFPTGLTWMMLTSLVVGAMFYFLYTVYEYVNSLPGKLYRRIFNKQLSGRHKGASSLSAFSEWVAQKKLSAYISLIYSMRAVILGLLYAGETLIVVVLIPLGFVVGFHADWLAYFILALIIFAFIFCVYEINEYRFGRTITRVIGEFEEWREARAISAKRDV